MQAGGHQSVRGRTSAEPGRGPAPEILLRLARGYACIFWGIPLTLLLYLHRVRLGSPSRGLLQLPGYVLGVVLIYWGLLLLYSVGEISPLWLRRVRRAIASVFLMVYFAPFVYWWQRLPYETFFLINILLLAVCAMWLLMLVNGTIEELAGLRGWHALRNLAEISAWSVIFLMVLPFLALFLTSLASTVRFNGNLFAELAALQRRVPLWAAALPLVPCAATMTAAWRGKEHCLEAAVSPDGAHADQ